MYIHSSFSIKTFTKYYNSTIMPAWSITRCLWTSLSVRLSVCHTMVLCQNG